MLADAGCWRLPAPGQPAASGWPGRCRKCMNAANRHSMRGIKTLGVLSLTTVTSITHGVLSRQRPPPTGGAAVHQTGARSGRGSWIGGAVPGLAGGSPMGVSFGCPGGSGEGVGGSTGCGRCMETPQCLIRHVHDTTLLRKSSCKRNRLKLTLGYSTCRRGVC